MGERKPLSVSDACSLADIIRAAQGNVPVARLMADTSNVIYGQARSVGDSRGNFAANGDDVRDLFLRVTTAAGWEAFWPIAALISEHQEGTFIVNYHSA